MNYFEMIEINLLEISSYEEAVEKAEEVVNSEKNEILKYINYLRYTYNTCDDIELMDKITQFLFIEVLADIERNSDINFGETLDLNLSEEVSLKEENTLNIEGIGEFVCVAQLSDNYETILILRDKDGEFHKYGCIDDNEQRGNKYVYLLEKENPEFYQRIIKSSIGTKANIISAITSDQSFRKTFIKEKIDIGYKFIISQKTNKGVFSNIITGTFIILKEPEIILKDSEPIEEEVKDVEPIDGMGISIEGIGMISGDDFMDMMKNAGGAKGLVEKMKSDMFADMIGKDVEDYDEDMKNMISDSVRLSDKEFQEKWKDKLDELQKQTPENSGVSDIEEDEDFFEYDEEEEIIDIDKVTDDDTLFRTIKSFKNQDIVILGACKPDDYSHDLGITDDESGFNLSQNGKFKENVSSDGFINIITFKDYLDNYKHESNFDSWQSDNTYLIRNFTGDVNLITKVENKQVDPDTLGDDFLWHDHSYGEDVDISVIIDLKTQNEIKIINLNVDNIDELSLNIFREKKIERVLDEDDYTFVLSHINTQIGKIIEIATKEDFNNGFTVSYPLDDEITSLTEVNDVFELLEGTYECEDITNLLHDLILVKKEKIKEGYRYFVNIK